MEVLPQLQDDLNSLDKIFLKSPPGRRSAAGRRSPNGRRRRSSRCRSAIRASSRRRPSASISRPAWRWARRPTRSSSAQAELKLPPTIIASFQGNAQAFQESLSTVPMLIVAALVVVYLILGVLYESYIHPLTILSTLPSAGVGALATLMLFGFDFSLIALIGVILLIGIVKKNGIMMVDFAMVAEREQHLSSQDAIRQAALLRFRPIMMTTIAAMLGGVPLMLGHGTGSEIRQPLGYAMVGGLIVSQALTLFTTPVIYLYLDRLAAMAVRREARARARSPGRRTRPRPHNSAARRRVDFPEGWGLSVRALLRFCGIYAIIHFCILERRIGGIIRRQLPRCGCIYVSCRHARARPGHPRGPAERGFNACSHIARGK